TAFQLRSDLFSGDADPILFIDFDDRTTAAGAAPGPWPRAPESRTNRQTLAQVLEFIRTTPPEKQAGAVMLDIDLATARPDAPEDIAAIRRVLSDWARTPGAPLLVLAREAVPSQAYDLEPGSLILPASDYDDIVGAAPNMFYATVKVTADKDAVVGDFLPYECVQTRDGPQVLYSAVLLLYGQLENGQIPEDAPVRALLGEAEQVCAAAKGKGVQGPEVQINYHFSMEVNAHDRVWPELPPEWDAGGRCPGGDRSIVRRLSAVDVAAAGLDASRDLLCGRLVIIGGTNTAQGDFQQTPLRDMAGPAIIGNAVRGLQLDNGGMQKLALPWQILMLIPVCVGISAGFAVTRQTRREYKRYLRRHPEGDFWLRLRMLPFNPVVLNWLTALGAHYVGVGILLVSLEWGLWGFLSAPAFAAAIAETVQEFAEDETPSRKPKPSPEEEFVAAITGEEPPPPDEELPADDARTGGPEAPASNEGPDTKTPA
ncbi:MAG TPA: CHASE2 domain-containing protein, partial [Caulobacteraceae bacterium]|nr:CHASE2 domain-containing protein [Caulobacteraceae bacterium]